MFTYISFFKSNLLKDFQKEDMNIENLKSKLAELARGFKQEDGNDQLIDFPVNEREEIKAELKLDDGITEEARRYMRVNIVLTIVTINFIFLNSRSWVSSTLERMAMQ